jgi:hypothetical protein
MRQLLLSIIAIVGFSFNVHSQNVTVPDPNFKSYLLNTPNINTNDDSEIQVSEAIAYTGAILCSEKLISNMTGLEAFVNIVHLDCSDNSISTLEVSSNVKMTALICSNNSIKTLDLSENISLGTLDCHQNFLSSLNVANGYNIFLRNLTTVDNPMLTCIQVDDIEWSVNNWQGIDDITLFNTNCSNTAVSDLSANQNKILLFPIPASSYLNIKSDLQIEKIVIIDVIGNSVKKVIPAVKKIEVSDLRKGVYFLEIQTVESIILKKFIKQ